MSESKSQLFGIRAVAIFEAVKAIFLVAVGCGLLSLINRDTEEIAIYLVKHLHLNPASKHPRIFIDFVGHITNTQLLIMASLALFDAVIRMVEAVGLWWGHEWGKWLGILTAGLYIPVEIYEMIRHLTWLKSATFITNVVIVIYLASTLTTSSPKTSSESSEHPPA